MNTNTKRMVLAAIAASSLAVLASCNRNQTETAKAPTQAEEMTAFCDQMATVAVTLPPTPQHEIIMRIQNKIIEKEWDTDTAFNECAKALDRKLEFVAQHTQAMQKSTQAGAQ